MKIQGAEGDSLASIYTSLMDAEAAELGDAVATSTKSGVREPPPPG